MDFLTFCQRRKLFPEAFQSSPLQPPAEVPLCLIGQIEHLVTPTSVTDKGEWDFHD